ncbi:Signal peptidase complex catalytic subunit S11C [Borealophlyctis nickersoniae]|nr:Signal peptidase complex catalytic subunit S11C [Borealophlyctis nickersoniae]
MKDMTAGVRWESLGEYRVFGFVYVTEWIDAKMLATLTQALVFISLGALADGGFAAFVYSQNALGEPHGYPLDTDWSLPLRVLSPRVFQLVSVPKFAISTLRLAMIPSKEFSKMSIRRLAQQALNLSLILASALMIWKGLAVMTNSESPIVVVLSESMEPAFQRGDLLFLTHGNQPINVGEICVFKIQGKEIPIVHRVVELHRDTSTGKQYMLTKGDNNPIDDRGDVIYNEGQLWIHEEHVVGRVKGFLPYVGMITILLNDYPQLKIALLVALGLTVVLSRED